MLIGDTAREVRAYLRRDARTSRPAVIPSAARYLAELDESLDDIPTISRLERESKRRECPRCNAPIGQLCYSGTGLPASAPHPERILRSDDSS